MGGSTWNLTQKADSASHSDTRDYKELPVPHTRWRLLFFVCGFVSADMHVAGCVLRKFAQPRHCSHAQSTAKTTILYNICMRVHAFTLRLRWKWDLFPARIDKHNTRSRIVARLFVICCVCVLLGCFCDHVNYQRSRSHERKPWLVDGIVFCWWWRSSAPP